MLAIALAEPLVKEAHDITIFEQDGAASVSLHLKFPAELDLRAAHEVAERVERGDTRPPGGRRRADAPGAARAAAERARPPTRARTRRPGRRSRASCASAPASDPELVELLSTDAGRVVFLTLGVGAAESLRGAHQLASELEDELRRRIAGIADVVVHTEP